MMNMFRERNKSSEIASLSQALSLRESGFPGTAQRAEPEGLAMRVTMRMKRRTL